MNAQAKSDRIKTESQKFREKVQADLQRATGRQGYTNPMVKKLTKRQFLQLTKRHALTLVLGGVWWTLSYEENDVKTLQNRIKYLEGLLKKGSTNPEAPTC